MADVSNVITLGIGTPSSIPYFLTFGLGIEEVVIPIVIDVSCTYTVRDPNERFNMVDAWPEKTTEQNYLYTIDWSFYAESDPIVLSSWIVDGGLAIWSQSAGMTSTEVFVGLGNERTICNLKNSIQLFSGAAYTQVVKLIIDNMVCTPRPEHGPGGAELACA